MDFWSLSSICMFTVFQIPCDWVHSKVYRQTVQRSVSQDDFLLWLEESLGFWIAEKIVSRLATLLKCISTGKKIRSLQSIGSWRAKTTSKTTKNVNWKCSFAFLQSFLFQVLTVAKCALSILQLNCNPYFRDKKKKSEICRHVLTSSTLRHNISRRRKDKNGYEM